MTVVPFAEWLPDMPDLGNPGATVAKNVWPRTVRSYGPVNAFATTTSALTARCQGFAAGRSSAGNVSMFAGDATKLYKLGGTTWADKSKVGGYSTGATESWRFIQYNQLFLGTNYTDAVQAWALDSSTAFADLSAGAPNARYIAGVAPGFVMLGNLSDATDGVTPNRVRWSGINAPDSWPTLGTAAAQAAQSDYQDLSTGGWVQAVLGGVGGAHGLVICDNAIHRVDYVGGNVVFSFTPIENSTGTPAPNSVVNVGPFAFFLGEPGGFYACNGAQSVPIGDGKVDKYFINNIDPNLYYRISAGVDPVNKLVFWAAPFSGHDINNTPNMILCYNWVAQRWSLIEQTVELIGRALSTGYTLEDLDSFGTIDTLPYSLDDRYWTGGRPILAGFGSDHKFGTFGGTTLAATLETAEFTDEQSEKRLLIKGLRPRVDGGTVTAQVGYRDTQDGAITYTTASSPDNRGICPQHISARFARGRVSIAANGDWDHAHGISPIFRSQGEL